MAWTLEDLQALEAAYATGALHVRWGDKSVQYDSRAELKARIDEIRRALGLHQTGMRVRNVIVDLGH